MVYMQLLPYSYTSYRTGISNYAIFSLFYFFLMIFVHSIENLDGKVKNISITWLYVLVYTTALLKGLPV